MKRHFLLIALLVLLATSLQAQIVGATNNSPQQKPSKSTKVESTLYKPTGHYLKLEAGFVRFFSVAYGYQISPNIMFGGGTAISFSKVGIPIYAEVILSTPRYAWSFFGDIKTGIRFDLHGSDGVFFIDPRIGFSLKNFGIALGFELYYEKAWQGFPDISLYYNIPLKIH